MSAPLLLLTLLLTSCWASFESEHERLLIEKIVNERVEALVEQRMQAYVGSMEARRVGSCRLHDHKDKQCVLRKDNLVIKNGNLVLGSAPETNEFYVNAVNNIVVGESNILASTGSLVVGNDNQIEGSANIALSSNGRIVDVEGSANIAGLSNVITEDYGVNQGGVGSCVGTPGACVAVTPLASPPPRPPVITLPPFPWSPAKSKSKSSSSKRRAVEKRQIRRSGGTTVNSFSSATSGSGSTTVGSVGTSTTSGVVVGGVANCIGTSCGAELLATTKLLFAAQDSEVRQLLGQTGTTTIGNVIVGGVRNTVTSSTSSTVAGGSFNAVSGRTNTVTGGTGNTATSPPERRKRFEYEFEEFDGDEEEFDEWLDDLLEEFEDEQNPFIPDGNIIAGGLLNCNSARIGSVTGGASNSAAGTGDAAFGGASNILTPSFGSDCVIPPEVRQTLPTIVQEASFSTGTGSFQSATEPGSSGTGLLFTDQQTATTGEIFINDTLVPIFVDNGFLTGCLYDFDAPLATDTVVISNSAPVGAVVPLSTSFAFEGRPATQMFISKNGWLSFNAGVPVSKAEEWKPFEWFEFAEHPDVNIAACWLSNGPILNSVVTVATRSVPSPHTVITWRYVVTAFTFPQSTECQVKLFDTGKIQIHVSNLADAFPAYVIGIGYDRFTAVDFYGSLIEETSLTTPTVFCHDSSASIGPTREPQI